MKCIKVCILLINLVFLSKIIKAQPTITAKSNNIVFTLDANGNKVISLVDVATVTSKNFGSPIVTVNPTSFNCTTIGLQTVAVTAVDAVPIPSAVRFSLPISVIFDASGNLYVADFGNHKIKKISIDGIVSTFAGSGSYGVSMDGYGISAGFNSPTGITADSKGNIYVADGHKVRKITPSGTVTTIAGQNTSGKVDGPGLLASFYGIHNLVVDPDGIIYLTDGSNNLIRKISTDGIVSTFAGTGFEGSKDGKGTVASFRNPNGIVRDHAGNIFVCDYYNNNIRKITPDGIVSTFAGSGVNGYIDGPGTTAAFNHPSNIIIDPAGNFFVTDYDNRRIRKITPDGTVSTFAGNGLNQNIDGTGTNASFVEVIGLTIDAAGNIFVASPYGEDIRKISPNAEVTTFAGKATTNGDVNGSIYTSIVNYKSTLQIPVTILSPLAITSTYNNITIPAYGSCNATLPDYTITATAASSCGGKIVFSQVPTAGTVLISGSSIPVTITATDALGTIATTNFQVSVTSIPSEIVQANIVTNTSNSCSGIPVNFMATVINGGNNPNYQWQVNGNNVGLNTSSFTSSTLNDQDMITCKITSSLSCLTIPTVNSNSIIVQINPNLTPAITITASATTICDGSTVTYTANATNGGRNPSYQWQVNGIDKGINQATFTSSNLINGDIVQCVLNSNAPCVANQTAISNQETVKVIPTITHSLTITASATTVFIGTKITFKANAVDAGTMPLYQWQINGINVGANSPIYTSNSLSNADIISCNMVSNSSAACAVNNSVTSNTIKVNVNTFLNAIKIPTAFSPNGDGINDLWNIPDLTDYKDCVVEVYSRYGQLIYQSRGYSKAWDGTLNGRLLPTGTYYYIISASNDLQKVAGNITILR